MASTVEELWYTGRHHEGAHAAVAVECEIPIDYLRIQVTTSWFGGPKPNGELMLETFDGDDEDVENLIVLGYAGPEAEAWALQLYHGISLGQARGMASEHAGKDVALIRQRFGELGYGGRGVGAAARAAGGCDGGGFVGPHREHRRGP